MPVNIRDVLEAPEGTLTIEGTEAHMVNLYYKFSHFDRKRFFFKKKTVLLPGYIYRNFGKN